jgi:tetraacyldisaccharide 4'-kinase
MGGTGKTPFVIMLASMLKTEGFRPAVLSRGYGGKNRKSINVVSDGERVLLGSSGAGDEPFLIAKSIAGIPVVTGRDRYSTGKYAVEHFGSNVLILDDAFQHRSIYRDIDIVLMNEERPFGNGFLIPRGELREPGAALERADIVVLIGSEERELPGSTPSFTKVERDLCVFRAYRDPECVVRGDSGEKLPLDYMRGKRILAFSGIARPDSFKKTITSAGGKLSGFLPFPDHHRYGRRDIESIKKSFSEVSAQMLLTTEKDGVKLFDFPDFLDNVCILKIGMKVSSPSLKKLEGIILEKLAVR